MPRHFVYIVRCADDTLYTGWARDPEARVVMHNCGRGAKYTASRKPVALVYVEACRSLSRALKREHEVKRRSRAEKDRLVQDFAAGLIGPKRKPSRRRAS